MKPKHIKRLNENDVNLIRELWREKNRLLEESKKISWASLAEKFECSPALIAKVVTNRVWAA